MSALDRFVAAAESGRLRADLLDLLDEEPFSRFEEWAASLSSIAEAVDDVRAAVEEWRDAERDTRADARDDALGAIETLVAAWTDSPLDVDKLEDWEPPDDE